MSASTSSIDQSQPIRDRFAEAGQDHVFAFWDRLDTPARARLIDQAAAVDLEALRAAVPASAGSQARGPLDLEPAPVERLPENGGDPARHAELRALGESLIEAGRVAALVMAGGQATRLGVPGPKGALPLGPISGRTLFELQAEKLRGLRRRHGRMAPWIVLTSHATDAATRALFEAAHWYDLGSENVYFVVQGQSPTVDFRGRLLLEAPDRLACSPDGHGGSLPALVASGVLDRLVERGIDRISTYQVDNPLVRVIDPLFLGLHASRDAQMSCKVVPKREPQERVGTVARLKGRVRVIEYTEVSGSHRDLRGPDGELIYWAGSIGMHIMDIDLVRRVGGNPQRWLPLHASPKKIPCLGTDGSPVVPQQPNGYKLERFVFDALAASRETALLEVRREEEYSPIKNPSGGESPETARGALGDCYRSWIGAAGLPVPAVGFELDHEWVDSSEDARVLDPAALDPEAGIVRVATGEVA